MSLKVLLLVVSLVSHCCTAPQRRNWTPQAILYLKGAQGHGSVLERPSRGEADVIRLVTHNQTSDGRRLLAACFLLLELLQRAVEEDGDREPKELN